jgi:hypothetical protein
VHSTQTNATTTSTTASSPSIEPGIAFVTLYRAHLYSQQTLASISKHQSTVSNGALIDGGNNTGMTVSDVLSDTMHAADVKGIREKKTKYYHYARPYNWHFNQCAH